MTSSVCFRNARIQCSNMHFGNLLDFAIEVAQRDNLSANETTELQRIERLRDTGEFWPGRGWTIEEDFETAEQCKLWSRVYFDLAQAIFLREIRSQDNARWQTVMIYLSESIARLFLDAVRENEKRWFPETRASRDEDPLKLGKA